MTQDETDAAFFDLVASIEIDVEDVTDVTTMSTFELTERINRLRMDLLSEGQYIHPRDPHCRAMHSELSACKIEMARRLNDGA